MLQQLCIRNYHLVIRDSFVLQAIFQRYPRPEKECQSFSLIYNDGSLDLVSSSIKFSSYGQLVVAFMALAIFHDRII